MRIKFNKEIEFYLKKIFFSQKYLLKKRLERSIKNNEENELKLVKDFILPGTDSIDIGVYRGVYSFQMSKFSKTVHAFEPNPIIYENLQKNFEDVDLAGIAYCIGSIDLKPLSKANKDDFIKCLKLNFFPIVEVIKIFQDNLKK